MSGIRLTVALLPRFFYRSQLFLIADVIFLECIVTYILRTRGAVAQHADEADLDVANATIKW